MIHAEKVHGILRNLDTYVGHLRSLAALDKAALLADFTRTGSLRYYLQVSIECCLDLANHLIAAQALRPPKDYADAFTVLGEAALVRRTLSQPCRKWLDSETDSFICTGKWTTKCFTDSLQPSYLTLTVSKGV